VDNALYRQGFTQNRELSWLSFNHRVLMEARDKATPLLERLKFISIFTSNLDEFFMIRVGSLFDLMAMKVQTVDQKSGLTPSEQLACIFEAVRPLYQDRDEIFDELEQRLREEGIYHLSYGELTPTEQKYVRKVFKNEMLPLLSPQIVDTHHPFPHLQNKAIHIGAMLKRNGKEFFSLITLPGTLPELLVLPGETLRYLRTEHILLEFVDQVFDTYSVGEKVQLCVTRNADIHSTDEADNIDSDFRKKMKKTLGQRKRLAPVRLELSQQISEHFAAYLCKYLSLSRAQLYVTAAPMKLSYALQLPEILSESKRKQLTYPDYLPNFPPELSAAESILRQVQKADVLLSFPYESMEPFLQMLREAAGDPHVTSIKITIYRLSRTAKLVDYLCAAAENGKDVMVIIELRARFDEQNNIDWSERLEAAGCRILYGFEDYKVHAKLCLITRKERGEIRYITQIGTGNYNEKTATVYTDLSLLTADQAIGRDANEFFKNMGIGNLQGDYEQLLVAPCSLKQTVIRHIEAEACKGTAGFIFLKLNSLTDAEIMASLKEASCAGVTIKLFVRGICCLLPGIEGKTENIQVYSIVDRFLEHSRVFCFGRGAEMAMYISSADLMTRNTERRVEVACPVHQEPVRAKIREILETLEYDNVKARVLLADGSYTEKQGRQVPLHSQQLLMDLATARHRLRSPDRGRRMGKIAQLWAAIKRFFVRRRRRAVQPDYLTLEKR
jgi:polyphosphate kinase